MITWNRKWVKPYESIWSVFEKCKLVNLVTGNELLKEINPEYVPGQRKFRNLYTLLGFDLEHINNILGMDLSDVIRDMESLRKLIKLDNIRPMSVFHTHLVFCSSCINTQFHSYLHQFKLITHCPFHLENLNEKCPECKKQINVHQLSNNIPYTCLCGCYLSGKVITDRWNEAFEIKDQIVIEWLKTLNKINV
ncbi:hypothetical protein [Paenibacillus sp. Soil787]|uniref:hypothetical protein n=1 Tax=Paenibacillus sp. Soil787 TaxID=1736411 RepID=UPI0006F4D74D|nr:hypothetical protein [Paenibacillus sp. Soil787]KRF31702.1 hypothetical protein ASG93_05025 [Paenibacillus sp. Soil787]